MYDRGLPRTTPNVKKLFSTNFTISYRVRLLQAFLPKSNVYELVTVCALVSGTIFLPGSSPTACHTKNINYGLKSFVTLGQDIYLILLLKWNKWKWNA